MCLLYWSRLSEHHNWDGQVEKAVSERFKLVASDHLDQLESHLSTPEEQNHTTLNGQGTFLTYKHLL